MTLLRPRVAPRAGVSVGRARGRPAGCTSGRARCRFTGCAPGRLTVRAPGRPTGGRVGCDHAATGEAGTITLLTIGLVAVMVLLVVAVVDVSAVYLARRDLAGACDSAALAAAGATPLDAVYRAGVDATLPVDAVAGRSASARVAAQVGAGTRTAVQVSGPTITVTCSRTVALPLGDILGIAPQQITAAASADSPVR